MLRFVFVGLSLILSLSCDLQINQNDVNTQANFQSLVTWQVSAQEGQAEMTELLAGYFATSDSIIPVDLIVGTENGAFLYENQIRDGSTSGWSTRQSVTPLTGLHLSAVVAFEETVNEQASLVVARADSNQLSLLRPGGEGGYIISSSVGLNSGNVVEIAGTSDGVYFMTGGSDGIYQVFEIQSSSNLRANGSAIASTVGDSVEILVGDLNGDNREDFILVGENKIDLVRNNGSGSFTLEATSVTTDLSRQIQAARLADLDADGDLDLCLATTAGFELYLNSASGDFVEFQTRSITLGETVTDTLEFEFVDLTEDLILDMLVISDSQGPQLFVGLSSFSFSNNTNVSFQSQIERPFGEGSRASDVVDFVVADIDGNLVLDLVFANQAGDLSVFFNLIEDGDDAL